MSDQTTFNEETWKARIRQRLQNWNQPAAHTLYGFLATMSLLPVVEALQQGSGLAVGIALANVAGSVGTGLLSDLVQEWAKGKKSRDEIMSELETRVQQNQELRDELDEIMSKLSVVQMAEKDLTEDDRAWFVQTLREELAKLGNLAKYEAVLTGDGVIIQGDDNLGVGKQGIGVKGNVQDAIINTGTLLFQGYQASVGKKKLTEEEFRSVLRDYLGWVERAYAQARLYGLESIQTTKNKPVRQLSDVFVPVTLREFSPPSRKEIERLAKTFPKDPWVEQRAFLQLAQEAKQEGKPVHLNDLLTVGDKLAIIGGAGSGKSTLLAFLASSLAHHALAGEELPFQLPKGRETLLPLVIPLRYFQQYRSEVKASPGRSLDKPRTGKLAGFIPWYLKRRSAALKVSEDFFDRLLLGGGCLLMLDGLDEIVRGQERGWMRQEVENLANDIFPGNRIIVTAREAGYRDNAVFGDDFIRLDVQPLEDEQIIALTRNWCEQLYPDDVANQTDSIVHAIQEINDRYRRQDLPPLIETPLMTTMVISVKWGETELPRERAKLYEAAVRVILQAQYLPDDESRGELVNWGGPWDEQREWLSHLALAMHRRGKIGATINETEMRTILSEVMTAEQLDQFVTAVRARGGLLEERADLFQFIHLTFQEFLAARLSAKQREDALPSLLPHIADSWWREVFLLLYGFAQTDYAPYAQKFLDWLSSLPVEDDDVKLAGLELAAAAVLEIERPEPKLRRIQAEKLANAVTDPRWRTSPTLRAAAANTLARLGDPRPGVGLNEDGIPDILWSDIIPPGPFIMGNTKEIAPMADDDEAPQFTCHLITEPYRISVHPITVAQYRAFVKDGGYTTDRYWTDAGREWRNRKNIRGPVDFGEPFHLPNHPQVGVSWYEAAAFCNWLSEKRGQKISLPTEAQWERAARHIDGRRYPWAEGLAKPDPDRMNYLDTGIGATSAVGVFPRGAAVCGAQDMSGNVWEWCQTKWRGNYENYERKADDDPEGTSRRVLRGGAFSVNGHDVRAAFRYGYLPDFRLIYLGFRVVFSPSTTDH